VTVSTGSWNRKHHLGIEFVIWSRESAWFWFVIDPCGKGAMIGATGDEARALREACWSIEEIPAICRAGFSEGTIR
jgi:hypothetical protein